MQVFAGHTGSVQCGEFTPDAGRRAERTSCTRGAKTISRQKDRNRVRRQYLHLLGPALAHPALQVNRKRFAVRPNTVVTGAVDGNVCIWDLKTNRLRTTLEHKVSCFFFDFPRLLVIFCF
jgi:WD40 repeat protein